MGGGATPMRTGGIFMTAAKKRTLNMTEGRLFYKVLLFVLPLMVTNLLQTFYNAADMMIVGLSGEPDAVGAIGTTSSFINLVLNTFIGFSVGANVVVAQRLGAKERDATSRSVHTALVVSVLFGAIGGAAGFLFARPILAGMGAEGQLLDLATLYTRIYFAGAPFLSLSNYLISIFRAKGDTKTPLYILTGSGLLNVLLNLFFVLVAGLSVEGVALATLIANAASAALLLLKLSRDEGPCRFSLKALCLDRGAFGSIVRIGLPAAIQGSLFSISNILIGSSILQVNNALTPAGSEFAPVVKGNAAAASLHSFAHTAQSSVYHAAITFTSQNVGAKKYHRVWRVMLCCYLLTFLISSLFSGVIYALLTPLLALYDVVPGESGSLAAIAYQTALTRSFYVMVFNCFMAFMDTGCGVVRGLGRSLTSTVVSLIGACGLRVAWILTVFRAYPTLDVLYVSYPISWGLVALAQFLCAAIILCRHTRESAL